MSTTPLESNNKRQSIVDEEKVVTVEKKRQEEIVKKAEPPEANNIENESIALESSSPSFQTTEKGKSKTFASLKYAAKLAQPSTRQYRSTYENFHEIFEAKRAAQLKRKYDFVNKKPLEEIEKKLAKEQKKQQRLQKLKSVKCMQEETSKNAYLNNVFATICPQIIKTIIASKKNYNKKINLSANGHKLAERILKDINDTMIYYYNQHEMKFVEQKMLKQFADKIAEWIESILYEMMNGHSNVEEQKLTEVYGDYVAKQLETKKMII